MEFKNFLVNIGKILVSLGVNKRLFSQFFEDSSQTKRTAISYPSWTNETLIKDVLNLGYVAGEGYLR